MGTRPRLPTNVIDGLEETQAILLGIWPSLSAACERAETRYQDPVLLAQLSRVTRGVADIEHHIRHARRGEFVPRRKEE